VTPGKIQPALGSTPYPTLESLYSALPEPLSLPVYHHIAPEQVPEPFHHLLVHSQHMTIAMEAHYRCKIAVHVLQRRRFDGWYARRIVLHPKGTEQIVQGGLVRIHLSMLDADVQQAILREDTPLGYVLISHDIMRQIEVTNYLRFEPGPAMEAWPGFDPNKPSFGRLGILHCDGQPAIELLEIVPPM
jgi:hypothetical protein